LYSDVHSLVLHFHFNYLLFHPVFSFFLVVLTLLCDTRKYCNDVDMPFWLFGCYVEMYDQVNSGEWGFSFRAESCIALTYTYLHTENCMYLHDHESF